MKFFPFVLALLLSVAAFAGPASNEPEPSRIWITDVNHHLAGESRSYRRGQRADRERTQQLSPEKDNFLFPA